MVDLVRQVAGGEVTPAPPGGFHAGSTLDTDFGLGSLERVELRLRLESAFDVRFADQDFLSARTVGDLIRLVNEGSTAGPVVLETLPTGPAKSRPGLHAASAATCLGQVLEVQAAEVPHRDAITFLKEGRLDRNVTWQELLDASLRAAAGLAALGVRPGERVGLMLPTGLPFVASFFGTLLLGAVPVPMYPPLRPDQVYAFVERQAAIIRSAGVRILVSFPRVDALNPWLQAAAGTLRQVVPADDLLASEPWTGAPAHPEGSAVAFIQYTSGSTGAPRGVALSHDNLLSNLAAFGQALHLVDEDVVVSWLPLYHDMGLIGMMLGALYYGLPLVLMGPEDFLARPSRWLRALSDYRGSVTAAPNFGFELCAGKIPDAELTGLDLSGWRIAINGAEPVRPDTLQRFFERYGVYGFAPGAMRPAYGLAEATLAVSMAGAAPAPRIDVVSREALDLEGWAAPATDDEPGVRFVGCGRPVQGVEVRVVDDQGRPVQERWQGRLQFRGSSAFKGYWENPVASAEVCLADGWVDSGDLGYLADGEIFPTGRRKALILVGGRNVHAEDVERAAAAVTGVRAGCVAAFGLPSAAEGTERLVVVAESRLRGDREVRRIVEEVRQRVQDEVGATVDRVHVVPPGSVPKTPSGKIRRPACRQALEAGTLGRRRSVAAQLVMLVRESPRFWVRRAPRLLYAAWVAGCVLLYAVVMYAATLLGVVRRAAGPASRALLTLLGLRLDVRGPRGGPGPVLLVPNHASLLDPVVLMAAWPGPVRFVTAAWIADHPVLRPVLRALGGLRVKRGGSGAEREVAQMQAALADGACLTAFAEGGLEVTPGLRPFMRGPFVAAARAGVAVVPVALKGTRRALRWGERVPRPGTIQVTFGQPVAAEGTAFDDVTRLAQTVRSVVAQGCGEPRVERRLIRED